MSCKHCEKTCLSFLPLRPSPVAKDGDLAWLGTAEMACHPAALAASLGVQLRRSHLALRLLRRGYLHIYLPKAPPGQQWRVYHVDDDANLRLLGEGLSRAPALDAPIAPCRTAGHDAAGQKLATIPDARAMGTVWLAYSANLWNTRLRDQNKGNPHAMVPFDPMAGGPLCFKPSEEALRRRVLECALPALRLAAQRRPLTVEPTYPFASLVHGEHGQDPDTSRVQQLAHALQQAAATSPATAGKELAVVLPDPIALKRELSDIRLLKQRALQQLDPQDELKLHSHYTLEGLAANIADARAMKDVVPVMTRERFEAYMRQPIAAMSDEYWVPLDPQQTGANDMGRVWTPKRVRLIEAQAQRFEAIARHQLQAGYDRSASTAWVDAHLQHVTAALQPYEEDWLQARGHISVSRYFALHFDEAESNRRGPLPGHSAGEAYCREAQDEPPPASSAALNEQYLQEYRKALTDATAYVWRIYVANQKELIAVFQNLTGDPNSDVGMRDKTVDLLKGLVDKDVLGDKLAAALKGRFNHNWLSARVLSFAHGQSLHLAQALAQAALRLGPAGTVQTAQALLHTAQYAKAWLAVLEQALNARLGLTVKRPVLVQGSVRADRVQRLAYGPPPRGSKPWSSKRQVQVTVLTDTEAVIAAQGRLQQLMAQAQAGKTLVAGADAAAALRQQHRDVPILLAGTPQTSTELLFSELMQQSRQLGRRHLALGAGHDLFAGTEGRLALAGVLINAIGLLRGLAAADAAQQALDDAQASARQAGQALSQADRESLEQKVRDARLGWYDSLGGLTGASLDSMRVGVQFMQLRTLGHTATLSVTALQFGSALTGAFGGLLNAYVSFNKGMDAMSRGLTPIAYLHWTAALSSVGTGFIGTVTALDYGLKVLVLRGIGGKSVETFAERVAAFVGARVLGLSVPVVGWGLLAIGVGSTVWAAAVEPSQLESWARQTPFGLGPSKEKFSDTTAMYQALQAAVAHAPETPAPSNPPQERKSRP